MSGLALSLWPQLLLVIWPGLPIRSWHGEGHPMVRQNKCINSHLASSWKATSHLWSLLSLIFDYVSQVLCLNTINTWFGATWCVFQHAHSGEHITFLASVTFLCLPHCTISLDYQSPFLLMPFAGYYVLASTGWILGNLFLMGRDTDNILCFFMFCENNGWPG